MISIVFFLLNYLKISFFSDTSVSIPLSVEMINLNYFFATSNLVDLPYQKHVVPTAVKPSITPLNNTSMLITSTISLSEEEINTLEKNEKDFAQINSTLEYNTRLDKNSNQNTLSNEMDKDTTLKNISALKKYQTLQTKGSTNESFLEKLYDQKEKIEKQIKDLEQKLKKASDPHTIEMLSRQLESLNALLISINAAILKALKESA